MTIPGGADAGVDHSIVEDPHTRRQLVEAEQDDDEAGERTRQGRREAAAAAAAAAAERAQEEKCAICHYPMEVEGRAKIKCVSS